MCVTKPIISQIHLIPAPLGYLVSKPYPITKYCHFIVMSQDYSARRNKLIGIRKYIVSNNLTLCSIVYNNIKRRIEIVNGMSIGSILVLLRSIHIGSFM